MFSSIGDLFELNSKTAQSPGQVHSCKRNVYYINIIPGVVANQSEGEHFYAHCMSESWIYYTYIYFGNNLFYDAFAIIKLNYNFMEKYDIISHCRTFLHGEIACAHKLCAFAYDFKHVWQTQHFPVKSGKRFRLM